jgi:ribosomal subunit interface protein
MVEEYVSKKLSSLAKFLKGGADALCEVELAKTTEHHKSGEIYKAEINITFAGRQFYVVSEESDIYAAVDRMRDEAEREIVSNKKKYLTVFRRGAGKLKNFFKRSSD